jgi:predicted N-acetyltransferase YhbS
MTDPEFLVRPERTQDIQSINELAMRSFGPGRFARTAYRIRENAAIVDDLSHTAWVGEELAGSIRFSAIQIGERSGALLLGPLMVEAKWTGKGCGRVLIEKGLELARAQGFSLVLLVGDQPYYERFGFQRVPNGQIQMPGPVDPSRLLGVELVPGAMNEFEGLIQGQS